MNQQTPISRRDVLKLSTSAAVAASLSSWLPVRAAESQPTQAAIRSVIVLWMTGGASQIDTFDMKPGHENGGPFQPIATSAPGLQICEHLPQMARLMHHCTLIRSMSTPKDDHLNSTRHMRTARFSSMSQMRVTSNRKLPEYVAIAPYARFNPVDQGSVVLGSSLMPAVVGEANRHGLNPDTNLTIAKSTSPRASAFWNALNVEEESFATQSAYGNTQFGQGCLAARRLVERGVPFVEVSLNDASNKNAFAWDTHADNFASTKNLMNVLDPAWSTLVLDLQQRGLLDSTLIVWMSEFGRTPTINAQLGRDHYSNAWTTVLCGGGLQGGQAIGKTSRDGMTVEDRPVSAGDLLGVIAHHLNRSETSAVTPLMS